MVKTNKSTFRVSNVPSQTTPVCYLEIRQSFRGCEELGTLQRVEKETSCGIVIILSTQNEDKMK